MKQSKINDSNGENESGTGMSFFGSSQEANNVWEEQQKKIKENMKSIPIGAKGSHQFKTIGNLLVNTTYERTGDDPIIKEMLIYGDAHNIPGVNDVKIKNMMITLECEPKPIPELAYLLKEKLS